MKSELEHDGKASDVRWQMRDEKGCAIRMLSWVEQLEKRSATLEQSQSQTGGIIRWMSKRKDMNT